MAGVRAYHEWMPIRQVNVDDKLRIWRNFQIGKLLVSLLFLSFSNFVLTFPGLDYARYT